MPLGTPPHCPPSDHIKRTVCEGHSSGENADIALKIVAVQLSGYELLSYISYLITIHVFLQCIFFLQSHKTPYALMSLISTIQGSSFSEIS